MLTGSSKTKANIWPLEMQGKTPLLRRDSAVDGGPIWLFTGWMPMAPLRYPSSLLKVLALTSRHRALGQIPRFVVPMKSQNNETSFDHERCPDCAWTWLVSVSLRCSSCACPRVKIRVAALFELNIPPTPPNTCGAR